MESSVIEAVILAGGEDKRLVTTASQGRPLHDSLSFLFDITQCLQTFLD